MKTLLEKLKRMDKKARVYGAALLAAGVLLMLFGKGLPAAPAQPAPQEPVAEEARAFSEPAAFYAERELEKRLEEAFSVVQDAGAVRVLLSFAPEKEKMYASDANTTESYSREIDGQGGSRESRSTQNQSKLITLTDKAGVEQPLVLRETGPKIAGAVIIAEGGDSVFVKDALTKAACTVLGVEANKVQVLKMKNHEGR